MKRYLIVPIIVLILVFAVTLINFFIINQKIDEIKNILISCDDLITQGNNDEGLLLANTAFSKWEGLHGYVGVAANSKEVEEVNKTLSAMIIMLEIGDYTAFKRLNNEAYMRLDDLINHETISLANIL